MANDVKTVIKEEVARAWDELNTLLCYTALTTI